MAKVMISVPDDLLERIDRFAKSRGMSRSALLRELAERELASDLAERQKRIRALLAHARPHGGDSAAFIRKMRDER
jgi:metal-responsive CopG/Arc/MetJ family transcriptional regulator